jgi:hypothetical protein
MRRQKKVIRRSWSGSSKPALIPMRLTRFVGICAYLWADVERV